MMPIIDAAEVADLLTVMRHQEETYYRCVDYIATSSRLRRNSPKAVDEECRVKMCEWCFQVVDFCKFRRETVGIGMSFLDRYLSVPAGRSALFDRKEYQLAAMSALYIAIKLHEPLEMDTGLLADLSRGCYTETDFADMEKRILAALEWRVNGPTPLAFVQHLMGLLPDTVHPAVATAVMDYARYQTELAVADHLFVVRLPSEIALAAVLNAIEGMDTTLLPLKTQGKFVRSIERYSGLIVEKVEETQFQLSALLLDVLSKNEAPIGDTTPTPENDPKSKKISKSPSAKSPHRQSPVSVAPRDSRSTYVR